MCLSQQQMPGKCAARHRFVLSGTRPRDLVLRMLLAPLHHHRSAASAPGCSWHTPRPCSDQKPPPGTLPAPYWPHSSVARRTSSGPGSLLLRRGDELSGFLQRSCSSWCFGFTCEEHRLLLSNSWEPAAQKAWGQGRNRWSLKRQEARPALWWWLQCVKVKPSLPRACRQHKHPKAMFVVLHHGGGHKRHESCTVSEHRPWCAGRLRVILEEGSRACDSVSPGQLPTD